MPAGKTVFSPKIFCLESNTYLLLPFGVSIMTCIEFRSPSSGCNRVGAPETRSSVLCRAHDGEPLGQTLYVFAGTLAPFFLASDNPMAMACFLLFTRPPLPSLPERSVPLFLRFIALSTDLPAAFPYLAITSSPIAVVEAFEALPGPLCQSESQ